MNNGKGAWGRFEDLVMELVYTRSEGRSERLLSATIWDDIIESMTRLLGLPDRPVLDAKGLADLEQQVALHTSHFDEEHDLGSFDTGAWGANHGGLLFVCLELKKLGTALLVMISKARAILGPERALEIAKESFESGLAQLLCSIQVLSDRLATFDRSFLHDIPCMSRTPLPLATVLRDCTAFAAIHDEALGLAVARGNPDPWFRCQALSTVARGVAVEDVLEIVSEALEAARELDEPNRRVSVASSPLFVLNQRGFGEMAAKTLADLLADLKQEPSPVRRASALEGLWDACCQLEDKTLGRTVLREFEAACLAPLEDGRRNRRGESYLVKNILSIQDFDGDEAERIADAIEGPTLRSRARAMLAGEDTTMFDDDLEDPDEPDESET